MIVNIIGGDMSDEEKSAYVERALEKYGSQLYQLDMELDGEYVKLRYHLNNPGFERVRRITGYLVGTMDKWNNAKRAEEHDRVKHQV